MMTLNVCRSVLYDQWWTHREGVQNTTIRDQDAATIIPNSLPSKLESIRPLKHSTFSLTQITMPLSRTLETNQTSSQLDFVAGSGHY